MPEGIQETPGSFGQARRRSLIKHYFFKRLENKDGTFIKLK